MPFPRRAAVVGAVCLSAAVGAGAWIGGLRFDPSQALSAATITTSDRVVPSSAPAPARDQAIDEPDLSIRMLSAAPAGALRPGQKLSLSVRLSNSTDRPVAGLVTTLRYRPERLSTRAELQQWIAGEGKPALANAGVSGSVPTIPARGSVAVTLIADPTALGITGETSFGPRGVTVTAGLPGQEAQASLRTTYVWLNRPDFVANQLSVVVPFTVPAQAGASPGATVRSQMVPGARLDRVLSSASDPSITWLLDPGVLAAARPRAVTQPGQSSQSTDAGTTDAGTTGPGAGSPTGTGPAGASVTVPATDTGTTSPSAPATTPTAAPDDAESQHLSEAATWLGRLTAGAGARPLRFLPFADPDLNSLARFNALDLLGEAQSQTATLGAQFPGVLPAQNPPTVFWPAAGQIDPAVFAGLPATGQPTVLLSSAQRPDSGEGQTGSAAVTLDQPARQQALIYDERLSRAFDGIGGPDSAQSTQVLLSDLAALTLEGPYVERNLLITTSRSWDPDPVLVQRALTTLRGLPWTNLAPLAKVTKTPDPKPVTLLPYPRSLKASELPQVNISGLSAINVRLHRFAGAFLAPAPVIDPLRERLLWLLNTGWRGHPAELTTARAAFYTHVDEATATPRIMPGGPYNLLTGSGNLPLYIENKQPVTAKVRLSVRPRSGGLSAADVQEIEVSPRTTQKVPVLVRSVVDGTVVVDVSLYTTEGTRLGPASTIRVRVHQNWEQTGLLSLAAVVALIFLIGIIRTVRRGRKPVPVLDAAAADPWELEEDSRGHSGELPLNRLTRSGPAPDTARDDTSPMGGQER